MSPAFIIADSMNIRVADDKSQLMIISTIISCDCLLCRNLNIMKKFLQNKLLLDFSKGYSSISDRNQVEL